MTRFDGNSYSDGESAALFERMYPAGFAGPDVLAELAPAGWERSPLVAVFHPSVEQVFQESADSSKHAWTSEVHQQAIRVARAVA